MAIEILDPTHEGESPEFAPASRLPSLDGATVGIISNGKKGTKPFFDAVAEELVGRYGVATIVRRTKSNYSAPADAEYMEEAKRWHALVAGVGD